MAAMTHRGIEGRESAMKHVRLDSQPEVVRQFVRTLSVPPDGTVLELEGEPVACVLPPPRPTNGTGKDAEDWTDAKNARRCDLIDREIDGAITPAEVLELRQLQTEMLRYQQKVAPWPIEAARQLHRELLKKAAKAQQKPDA